MTQCSIILWCVMLDPLFFQIGQAWSAALVTFGFALIVTLLGLGRARG